MIYYVWLCLTFTTSVLQITANISRYLIQSHYKAGHLSSLLDAIRDNALQYYKSLYLIRHLILLDKFEPLSDLDFVIQYYLLVLKKIYRFNLIYKIKNLRHPVYRRKSSLTLHSLHCLPITCGLHWHCPDTMSQVELAEPKLLQPHPVTKRNIINET